MGRHPRQEKDNSSAANAVEKKKQTRSRWTTNEHWLFLAGVQKYGSGNWKDIGRHVVKTRSSTQIASHAQKHYIRQQRLKQDKTKRLSINDITLDAHGFMSEKISDPTPVTKIVMHSPTHRNFTDQHNSIDHLPCCQSQQFPHFIDHRYSRVQHHFDPHMLQELEQELNPPHNVSPYEMRAFKKSCDFMEEGLECV